MNNLQKSLVRMLPFLAVGLLFGCAEKDQFYSNVLRTDSFVQSFDDQRMDFLWVLDNSGSMTDRTTYVKDNINTFLQILSSKKAIDYQMAITTVDYFTQQGKLSQNSSGLNVVKSVSSSNPASDFASIINTVSDSPTSFWEQGLESAYQAVNKYKNVFSRQGVPLVIIAVTDAEDYSCGSNCFGVEPEHNTGWIPFTTDRYVSFFKNLKASENSYVSLYPIVGQSNSTCSFEDIGTRYLTLMNQLGTSNFTGSMCPNDIAASYQGVAKAIANRGTVFQLSNTASGDGIIIYVNGVLISNTPDNYTYDAATNSINFNNYVPPKGATIEVIYTQKTS